MPQLINYIKFSVFIFLILKMFQNQSSSNQQNAKNILVQISQQTYPNYNWQINIQHKNPYNHIQYLYHSKYPKLSQVSQTKSPFSQFPQRKSLTQNINQTLQIINPSILINTTNRYILEADECRKLKYNEKFNHLQKRSVINCKINQQISQNILKVPKQLQQVIRQKISKRNSLSKSYNFGCITSKIQKKIYQKFNKNTSSVLRRNPQNYFVHLPSILR